MKVNGIVDFLKEGIADTFTWIRIVPFFSIPTAIAMFSLAMGSIGRIR